MMRVLAVVGSFYFLMASGIAAAETWSNVPLIDTMCATKVKEKPDAHTKACALQCEKSGFGIVASDGTYLRFDDNGNAKALAALKATKKVDHLRVSVTGERQGETIKVDSVRIE
jgi:hypothetical protein